MDPLSDTALEVNCPYETPLLRTVWIAGFRAAEAEYAAALDSMVAKAVALCLKLNEPDPS